MNLLSLILHLRNLTYLLYTVTKITINQKLYRVSLNSMSAEYQNFFITLHKFVILSCCCELVMYEYLVPKYFDQEPKYE